MKITNIATTIMTAAVISTALKPSVADAVNVKAQASGLSAEQWMSGIIEAAAQKR